MSLHRPERQDQAEPAQDSPLADQEGVSTPGHFLEKIRDKVRPRLPGFCRENALLSVTRLAPSNVGITPTEVRRRNTLYKPNVHQVVAIETILKNVLFDCVLI